MPDQDIDNFPIIDLDDELPIVDIEKDRKKSKLKAPSKPIKPISITPEMGEASLAQQEKILKERSEKLQQFKRPSLPPQDLSPDKFRFETTPFRETPEQYLERSAPPKRLPTTIRPEEKGEGRLQALKEGRLLTAIFGDPLPESEKIRQEQRLYDTLGPTGYSVVEGVRRAGRMLGEPFEQTYGRVLEGEMPGGPPKPVRPPLPLIRQEREAPISKVLPPVIEYGSMFIPLRARGGGPRIDEGPLPELGGPAPKIPPELGPGRPIEGQPPSGGPLELRKGRTIVGFPPVRPPVKPGHIPPPPEMLARRQTEPFPMHDQLIMSKGVGPIGEPIADDLSFDLLPGLRPGQAPVMITPGWVVEAATGISNAEGVNMRLENVPSFKNTLITMAPSRESLSESLFRIEELVRASKEEGLGSISLINREVSEDVRNKIISHETFHAGQVEISQSVFKVHDPEWARNQPIIQEIIERNPNIRSYMATPNNPIAIEDILAAELPTYVAAGQGDRYFDNPTLEVDFSYDYYKHLAEKYGSDALTILETTAKLPPKSLEVLQSARSTYESYKRELSTSTPKSGAAVAGPGQQPGDVRSVSGVAEGGLTREGDQEEIGRVVEETPSVPARPTREINLERFLEQSRVKVPVYHGTSSPTEITKIDPSKFDPEALYGPGFYMTQSPDVAAGGEGGYASTKISDASIDYSENWLKKQLKREGFDIGSTEASSDYYDRKHPTRGSNPATKEEWIKLRELDDQAHDLARGTPHAYNLYANIKRPLDMDAPVNPDIIQMALDVNAHYPVKQDGVTPLTSLTNGEMYRYILPKLRDVEEDPKVAFQEHIQKMGYDGITHIGGIGKSVSPKFDNVDDAVEYAERVGGQVRGINEYTEEGLNKWVVDGHRVWIAFNPQQVKSATGNVGTFDPASPEMSLSTAPPFKEGDLIKVKGMGPAKVTKVFDDGLEVTYESNNAVDEVNFNAIESKLSDVTPSTSKVTKVTSIVTPKGSEKGRVPSLPGPMRIKKNRLFVNRIGPGDEPGKVKIEFGNGAISQFDIKDIKDASGRKIKDPIYYMLIEDPPGGIISPPPPPTPRDPSYPPGGESPLFTPIVGVTHTRVIAKKFIDLMTDNKIEYDTTKPPSTQIYEAMIRGDLKDIGVENILKEEGIEWDDFIEDVLGTYSVAGKTLQPLSEIEQRHWKRLRDENPALFNKLIPAHRQVQMILEDLNKTTLGMSLWRRSGRMIQKAVLTQVATAATNFIGAAGRVPMDAGSSAIGQAMRQMMEGEGTFGEKMDKAREAARETFNAGFEAWRALNPMQIEALSRGQLGREYEGYENIVQQLETYFPDLHAKLFTKPMEETAQKLTGEKLPLHVELDPRTKLVGARENVNNMKMLLPKVKDKTKRRFLQQEINKLESNIKREERVITKMGFRAPEMFYDQLLRPMQFGEFLMRKARFVSRLGLELKDRGVDLNQVIQEGSFKNISPDAIKSSINDALEFTMALEPTNDPNANNFERASYHVVKLMNHLGPLALVTDTLFVRAMYSAFNTFYEYSPMPLLNPGERMRKGSFGRIFRGKNDIDPATGEPYRTNPASRDDYDKFGRMAVGTILYALAAALIKFGLIGDNWYEVKTGKKDKKGNPIYVDIRRYIPQARIFQLAYLIDRGFTDRMADVHIGREALDIATGIKRYETDPDLISTLDAIGEYWGGPDWNPREIDKSSQFLGRYPAALLTPLLNIRSMIAAHDEDENIKKDLRGSGFWGPSIDRFPWLRQRLPDLTYPTYQGKIPLSESPALQQFGGVQVSTSPDFMGREFNRMGISIREYLQRDPDPVIDKAQNEIFSQITGLIGESLEANPEYISASNNEKAALWEMYLKGDNGIVSQVKEAALQANPIEAARRGIMRQVPGRFIRKTTGITETLEGMREK